MNHLFTTQQLLALALSTALPLVSSLLARASWPGWVVGYLTAALSAATGFVTEGVTALQHGDAYDWKRGALTALGALLVAWAARARIWLGTEIDAKAQAVGSPKETVPEPNPQPAASDADIAAANAAALADVGLPT